MCHSIRLTSKLKWTHIAPCTLSIVLLLHMGLQDMPVSALEVTELTHVMGEIISLHIMLIYQVLPHEIGS